MKKLSQIVKESTENRIKGSLTASDSIFVLTYAKLSSPDLCSLRLILRGAHATLFVAKNTVARRALKDAGFENLSSLIQGPCGLVFIKDEPVNVSKLLCDFTKTHEQLKIEGGLLNKRMLEPKEIQALAKLPSKEVLRGQVVMTLKSPIFGIVVVLKANLRKVVFCLQQIKDKARPA